MFIQAGADALLVPRSGEGSDIPSAMIEPYRIMVSTRTRTGRPDWKSDVVTIALQRHAEIFK